MQKETRQNKIAEMEKKIKGLKERMPAHSIPVTMMLELEDLEEELKFLAMEQKSWKGL
jgi:hypothetical protein